MIDFTEQENDPPFKEIRKLLNPIMKEFSIPATTLLELLEDYHRLCETEQLKMKEHIKSQMLSELTATAIKFGNSQQLRERLKSVVGRYEGKERDLRNKT